VKRSWNPPTDELTETVRRSCVTLEHWEETLDEFLATGDGVYDTPAENVASLVTLLTDYDVAIPEMMFTLVWRFVREDDREGELAELYEIVEKQLARIGLIQLHGMARGWRFDDEEELTARRMEVWEAARSELDNQVGQAREERERGHRAGIGARLGRLVRRPAQR
jgi:hypothetical protein